MDKNNDGKTRLESWKNIAAYLNVTVRTAQKWEAGRGLPIERQSARSAVIAYVEDLEQWRSGEEQKPSTPGSRLRAGVVALGLVTLLSLAGVVAFFFTSSPEPERCEWRDGQLRVLDASSNLLWIQPAAESDPDQFETGASFDRSRIRDLDGDGHSEVLANFRATATNPSLSRVACFEQDGALRWEFRPGAGAQMEGSDVSRDYLVQLMAITRHQQASRIVLASNHRHRRLSQIALLDPATGKLLAEHLHPGWATAMLCADLDGNRTDEVVVAEVEGRAPGLDSPVLLRLDLVGMFASRLARDGNPVSWRKSGYCVFPRPDVCEVSTRSNYQVQRLREIAGNIEIELIIETAGNLLYLLDQSFKVIECRPSDSVYHYHDWAFRQKALDHRLDEKEIASWAQVKRYPQPGDPAERRPTGIDWNGAKQGPLRASSLR